MEISIAPTIGPLVTGPLGLIHLPRLWQKCLLAAHGLLAEGYKSVGPGFDHWLLDAIGVAHEDVKAYFEQEKPDYLQFEAWIKAYPGVRLDEAARQEVRIRIEGYVMKEERRTGLLERFGFSLDSTISAPELVQLDSWADFHEGLAKGDKCCRRDTSH